MLLFRLLECPDAPAIAPKSHNSCSTIIYLNNQRRLAEITTARLMQYG